MALSMPVIHTRLEGILLNSHGRGECWVLIASTGGCHRPEDTKVYQKSIPTANKFSAM